MSVDATIQVWQCVGCGRVEGPAQCIGVCQDRIAELVDVSALHAARAEIRGKHAFVISRRSRVEEPVVISCAQMDRRP